jgi:YEATS domain-containing protein 4
MILLLSPLDVMADHEIHDIALDHPPYEVTETGWGEFEIVIKIYFQDPTEKSVTLYHHLQLYPKDDALLQVKKPVLVEHYDEIVIN